VSLLVQVILTAGLPANSFADTISDKEKKLVVHFFGSETCGECLTVRKTVLEPLAARHSGVLDVQIHDIENEQNFQLLMDLKKRYEATQSSSEELFFPDTFLTGFDDIMRLGEPMVERYIAHPDKWQTAETAIDTTRFKETLSQKFQEFTFLGILLAGLADGVNPCAIATMIFLISFLALQKRRRSEILVIGLCFTSSVFATYLLMGIGAFKALTFLGRHLWISKSIKWTAIAFAGTVGIICFRDAFMYKKTGKAKDIKLQLPKAVKVQIHKVISRRLSGAGLVVGAIITGFLVTLLEAVCTGQVYLPTIVLMTRQHGLKLTGWLYLMFYNFLFVLPLLVVMVLAYFGLTWEKLSKAMQTNLVVLKFLLGTVLILLAAFLKMSL
jgi:hypothetical protein